ncbi:MAG: helix-turn-helix domain-containing protein [Candidatus Nanohaloarchaea archaeon]
MDCSQELKDLLNVLYDLSPRESEVLSYLCREEARIEELSELTGKDRSTVQKYLYSLRDSGLVSRESVPTSKGKGRYFVYYVKDVAELKEKVRARLEDWEEKKLRVLEEDLPA